MIRLIVVVRNRQAITPKKDTFCFLRIEGSATCVLLIGCAGVNTAVRSGSDEGMNCSVIYVYRQCLAVLFFVQETCDIAVLLSLLLTVTAVICCAETPVA
jgi:hypothetical protein